jgi:hypothetical protein
MSSSSMKATSQPRSSSFLLALALTTLAAAGWGYGCGRTSLDEGLDPVPGVGGNPGAGGLATGSQGGNSGRGGQAGSGAPNPCGTTICRSGSETCCTRTRMGQTSQVCVAAGDPMACAGGIATACIDSAQCGPSQSCCGSLANMATTCVPLAQCTGGFGQFVLCTSNSSCPASAPRCCPLLQGLGACLAANTPC